MHTKNRDKFDVILQQADCLYNLEDINRALDRMASAMTRELQHTNPLILCVMTGALITTGHLVTRLNFLLEMDYIHVTRYRGTTRGGDLHWLVEPRLCLTNRTVVIVDDILDGGLTLASIIDYCKQNGAKSVYTAVLVNKQCKRELGGDIQPDFVGLTTENRFLFGFGLDYEEHLRNVAGIYAVNET